MKKFDLFLTKAELQKIHKDKIQYRSDESLQFMFASRDKVKNDIQWAEDKLIKKLIKKFNQSEPYVNLNRMFYGKNEVKRFRDNLFIKYYIKSHLSDIENPDQNSHKQDKNRLTSQAIYRLRTFRDIGMEDWQLPIQMVTEPFFTLEYLNDQDLDGFRKLKDLNSSQRLYLTNRIRAYESLISVFRMGLPYEGFALGKTSDSKFEAKIQTIASFINNITQEISNTTLLAQTFDKAGYSRFKRLKNIYSSSTHSGILNLNEIFWFETAIEFFIASLFDGDCAAFNSFCVCSYDNFYGDSNRIHRNSLTYKPFSEFLNHLALDFDFQRARHFSINVNGISIDVTTRSIFEREIILKAVELGVLESIIPPNIFDKLHSNYLLKDGSDIRLYFEHSDGINHYLLLDIGWKFVNDGGKILVFECLGYPENTQPFGQSPPEIYGPNKDLGCLSLVNGPDSIFPDSNWKGYCPVYILYPRSVVEKYYFSIKVQYIGIIAPLITQAQYYQLVDVIRAHPENKFEYSIVHLSSGKFNRNISTLEAKNIQTSFGLNLQRQLDGNYVCIGISPKMQKWWDNFHASLDNDSKMRQQIDHLISLAFRFKT